MEQKTHLALTREYFHNLRLVHDSLYQIQYFYNKEQMNEYKFAKVETKNEVKKGSFVKSFLSSLRNKMRANAKK